MSGMPNDTAPQNPRAEEPRASRPRRAPDQQFLIYDLNASLVVAKTIRESGGDSWSPEQLGAALDYKNTKGGGFVARIFAARAFGLIETVQGRYRITPRAEAILWEVTPQAKAQALRDAFLDVALFRSIFDRFKGTQIPVELGMNNLLRTQYQVPPDRVSTAYRVLMDSADTAGFFPKGRRTQLVEPIIGAPSTQPADDGAEPERPEGPKPRSGGNGLGGGAQPPNIHPSLWGLIQQLPAPPHFPRRREWEDAWKAVLDYVYEKEEPRKSGG
jgi:hypothetical protein